MAVTGGSIRVESHQGDYLNATVTGGSIRVSIAPTATGSVTAAATGGSVRLAGGLTARARGVHVTANSFGGSCKVL